MRIFYFIVVLNSFTQFSIAQLNHQSFIRLNTEVGYYDSRFFSDGSVQRLILRIDGVNKFNSVQINTNFSIVPEFMSLSQNIFNLKANAGLNCSFQLLNTPFNLFTSIRYFNFFPENEPDQVFNEQMITLQINPHLFKKSFLLIKPGYYQRELDADSDFAIKYLSLLNGIVYRKDKKNIWQFLLSTEKYIFKEYQNYSGFRIGPSFSYIYKGRFILNLSYKLLRNYPDNDSLSVFMENYFTFITGYYLTEKLSITFFINYVKVNSINKTAQLKDLNRLERQNELYNKLTYDLSKKKNCYLKIAHQQDQYIFNNIKLSNLQVLLGFELNF